MAYPLFTIITATFNAGDGLAHTIASVRDQHFRNYEHIIKDAGSTDGSVQLYALPANDYSPNVICRPDSGVYDAMNQAMEAACGKFVIFLNAGDTLYSPEVLEKLAPFCLHDEAPDLIYCDYVIDGGKTRIRAPSKITRFYLYRTMLCHQVCFVRRKCFHDLGFFNTQLRIEADYDFLLRLMLRPQAKSMYVPMIVTTFLGGGISSDPAMFSLMTREVRGLRNKYFQGWERLAFGVCYACTLPRLRIGLMRSPKLRSIAKLYRAVVNLLYILCGGKRRCERESLS